MSEHAAVQPSSLDALRLCPGRWNATQAAEEAGVVDESSPAAERGTKMHGFAANLANRVIGGPEEPIEGLSSEDQLIAAQAYTEAVENDDTWKDPVSGKLWIEQKVEIGKFCGLPPGILWGTMDIGMAGRHVAKVKDYKFGRHVIDPRYWLQGKAYAIGLGGLLDWSGLHRGINDREGRIELSIVQPEAPEMERTAVFSINILEEWAAEIKGIVESALRHDAPRIPGDACKFCLAKDTCRERLDVASEGMFKALGGAAGAPAAGADPLAHLADLVSDKAPGDLSADEVGRILDQAPFFEGLFKDLRARAVKMLNRGDSVPGWKMVPGRNKRKWTGTDEEVIAGLKKCGLKQVEIFPPKTPTVPAVEPIIRGKTKKMQERFAAMYVSEPGNPVLAPEGDSRPSVGEAMFDRVPEAPAEPVATEPTKDLTPVDDDDLPEWMK